MNEFIGQSTVGVFHRANTFSWRSMIKSLLLLVLVVLPLVVDGRYVTHLVFMCGLYAVLALSLDLALGRTGLFSLAHAAFAGVGAYSSALLSLRLDLPPFLSLLIAVVLTGFMAALIGSVMLRLGGHFLALATLGLTVVTYQILLNWLSLTRGPLGITGIPDLAPSQLELTPTFVLEDYQLYYYVALLLLVAVIWFLSHLSNTRIGYVLLAVRDDELAAEGLGIPTFRIKLLAFTMSAIPAGAVGALWAHYLSIISPEMFTFWMSVNLILIVVIGGPTSLYGIITAAVIMTMLPEYLREFDRYRMIVYGTIVLMFVLFLPGGLSRIGSQVIERLEDVFKRRSESVDRPDHSTESFSKTGARN